LPLTALAKNCAKYSSKLILRTTRWRTRLLITCLSPGFQVAEYKLLCDADALHSATKHLSHFGRAIGYEVDTQNKHIAHHEEDR
jgi:hypothetical protein